MQETKIDRIINMSINTGEKTVRWIGRTFFGFVSYSIILTFNVSKFLYNIWIYFHTGEIFFSSVLVDFSMSALFAYSLYKKFEDIDDIEFKILKFCQKLYSEETRKLCFEPLIADWKKERSEAFLQAGRWKADGVTVRYVLAFFAAMIRQSSLGRFLETIFTK